MNYETLTRAELINIAVQQAYQIAAMDAAIEYITTDAAERIHGRDAQIEDLQDEIDHMEDEIAERNGFIKLQDAEIDNMKMMIDTSQVALSLALEKLAA